MLAPTDTPYHTIVPQNTIVPMGKTAYNRFNLRCKGVGGVRAKNRFKGLKRLVFLIENVFVTKKGILKGIDVKKFNKGDTVLRTLETRGDRWLDACTDQHDPNGLFTVVSDNGIMLDLEEVAGMWCHHNFVQVDIDYT